MTIVTVAVHEPGSTKIESQLDFELDAIPQVGSYISVYGTETPWSSRDLIVRNVLHALRAPLEADQPNAVGHKAANVVLECDPAIGPCLVGSERERLESAERSGVAKIERLKISRRPIGNRDAR
jgi:hypothetical protein